MYHTCIIRKVMKWLEIPRIDKRKQKQQPKQQREEVETRHMLLGIGNLKQLQMLLFNTYINNTFTASYTRHTHAAACVVSHTFLSCWCKQNFCCSIFIPYFLWNSEIQLYRKLIEWDDVKSVCCCCCCCCGVMLVRSLLASPGARAFLALWITVLVLVAFRLKIFEDIIFATQQQQHVQGKSKYSYFGTLVILLSNCSVLIPPVSISKSVLKRWIVFYCKQNVVFVIFFSVAKAALSLYEM